VLLQNNTRPFCRTPTALPPKAKLGTSSTMLDTSLSAKQSSPVNCMSVYCTPSVEEKRIAATPREESVVSLECFIAPTRSSSVWTFREHGRRKNLGVLLWPRGPAAKGLKSLAQGFWTECVQTESFLAANRLSKSSKPGFRFHFPAKPPTDPP
jgi:hypothetical protein